MLEAESERIEKEKENLELKQSLMRLQSQMKTKRIDGLQNERTQFEGAPQVI